MSDQIITVTDPDGFEAHLDTIERHILYCADEGRDISLKYGPRTIDRAREFLSLLGLLTLDTYEITPRGRRVVQQLRSRPRD